MQAVRAAGFSSALISYEELVNGNVAQALKFVKESDIQVSGVYRGWMLTPLQYEALYTGLLQKNIRLVNIAEEYLHTHYLPASYSKIRSKAPVTKWLPVEGNVERNKVLSITQEFGDHPIIIKDYVKSEKHYWEETCFIPIAFDQDNVQEVITRFLALRGDSLNEGLVFRAFEELEYLTRHSQSGMPLTKEFRLFFAHRKLVGIYPYWSEGKYGDTETDLSDFLQIAETIDSRFFSMDIAQKKNGEWVIIELGDGQVTGLPDQADKFLFYEKLYAILSR
ncbi:ATP-grasp domain-containing protein [Rapidithrix thailandica]|uniref:ATP-grasp domain-containing protein n=1 Tax=Rapidithrix thailandica TaxID=413964 RepID=A0AAW9S415_9BACT